MKNLNLLLSMCGCWVVLHVQVGIDLKGLLPKEHQEGIVL